MSQAVGSNSRVAPSPNCEIGVSEFLERCVGGFPPGILPPVAIAGHRIAWARFQETGDPDWRDVAEMALRAVSMARDASLSDAEIILSYLLDCPTEAFPKSEEWPRRRVRSYFIAIAKRWVRNYKSPRYATVT